MSINIVVCVNESFQMGNSKTNDLLYKIKHDMQRFTELTLNSYVVMGRNTFESLPTPLKQRTNVVLTSDQDYHIDEQFKYDYDVIIEHDFERILNHYKYTGSQDYDLNIIGGSSLFAEGIHWSDNIYLTMVHDENHPNGDIYFPSQELSEFKLLKKEKFYNEKLDLHYSFIDYKRKADE